MAATALRIARELRGDERPFTPRGDRPSTSSGARGSTPDEGKVSELQRELEEVRAALEKEKRNSRSLEQYLSELQTTKEQELRDATSDAKMHQAALAKAEAHAASLEELYKGQVAKLTATVERLQARPAAGAAAAAPNPSDSFAAVLREEMRVMQNAFTLKLQRAQDEAAAKAAEAGKQSRALQEQLLEEKRKNANLMDKLSRAASSPTAASAAGSGAAVSQFPAPPASARGGSAAGKAPNPGSTSSRATPAGSTAASATVGSHSSTKPIVKSATKGK